MDFYIFLEKIMDERNLSIPDIARMSELSDSTVRSAIDRKQKRVALDVALKLSAGLNVPVEEISGYKQKGKPIAEDELSQIKKEFIEFVSTLTDEQVERVHELVRTALRLGEK